MEDLDNLNIETRLLLEAIFQKYGYDFRDYSWAAIKRRIRHRCRASGLSSISEMQHKILYQTDFFEKILLDLTINVTEMFRDPHFYRVLRQNVIRELKDEPFLKVWHAGCSTGEEAYSMAILLKEEGLYDKTQIYATDVNESVLQEAKEGIFPLQRMKLFTRNYLQAGGKESFSDYYTASYESAIVDKSLRNRIVFANHNLVTDGVFGEMHIIICRNVLIYFNKKLRNRVLGLFTDSLADKGFLCLGTKESILFSGYANRFTESFPVEKIYRKNEPVN